MSADEWDSTSWWEQKLLQEGLDREQPWLSLPQLKKVYNPLDLNTGAFEDQEDEDAEEEMASLSDLAAMGFKTG